MNEITTEIIQAFKDRMHLNDGEEENLKQILEASVDDLIVKCGDHDITKHRRFRELVFERSRYVYNDALEYFNDNFLSQILDIGLDKALSSEGGEIDET